MVRVASATGYVSLPNGVKERSWIREETSQTLSLTRSYTMTLARYSSSWPLFEKHIKRYDPAVPRDDEVLPGVSRHFTRPPRYPWNHPLHRNILEDLMDKDDRGLLLLMAQKMARPGGLTGRGGRCVTRRG